MSYYLKTCIYLIYRLELLYRFLILRKHHLKPIFIYDLYTFRFLEYSSGNLAIKFNFYSCIAPGCNASTI